MLFEISHMSNRILAILNIMGAISRRGKKLLQKTIHSKDLFTKSFSSRAVCTQSNSTGKCCCDLKSKLQTVSA